MGAPIGVSRHKNTPNIPDFEIPGVNNGPLIDSKPFLLIAPITQIDNPCYHSAIDLLKRGFWPIPLTDKGPRILAWGRVRPTLEFLTEYFQGHPDAGVGLRLGPESGNVDLEIDGPEGRESLLKVLGDEIIGTLGWSSKRGGHAIFQHDPRLEEIAKSYDKGIFKDLPGLPGLELRIGLMGRQYQSACPPTGGRQWNGVEIVAKLPEAFYSVFEAALERESIQKVESNGEANHVGMPPSTPLTWSALRAADGSLSAEERCRRYLAKVDPAVSGQGGHNQTMRAAGIIVRSRIPNDGIAWQLLNEYNARCQPEWSEKELRHKLDDAFKNEKRTDLADQDPPEWEGRGQANHAAYEQPDNQAASKDALSGSPTGDAKESESSRTKKDDSSDSLILYTKKASAYKIKPVEFLDGGIFPAGKLVTIVGMGGAGKGMFWANYVADLSRGRLTLGMSYEPTGPIEILLVGCEDGYEDTVIPRLRAANANLDNIHILKGMKDEKGRIRPFSLKYLEQTESWFKSNPGIRLTIIDPLPGYVARADVDDHSDADLRSVLEPFGELASDCNVTIQGIKHFNKDESKSVAARVGGSVAYVNIPRACFVVGGDPTNPHR